MNHWDIIEVIEPALFLIVFLLIVFSTRSLKVVLLSFAGLGTLAFVTLFHMKFIHWSINYCPWLLPAILILAIFGIIVYFVIGIFGGDSRYNRFNKKNIFNIFGNMVADINQDFKNIPYKKKLKILVVMLLYIIFSLVVLMYSLATNLIK